MRILLTKSIAAETVRRSRDAGKVGVTSTSIDFGVAVFERRNHLPAILAGSVDHEFSQCARVFAHPTVGERGSLRSSKVQAEQRKTAPKRIQNRYLILCFSSAAAYCRLLPTMQKSPKKRHFH